MIAPILAGMHVSPVPPTGTADLQDPTPRVWGVGPRLMGHLPLVYSQAWWGLLGCIFIALGSISVGITPRPDPVAQWPVLGLLRTTTTGQGLGIAAIIAGVALLLTAWLSLGCEYAAQRGPSVRQLAGMITLWSLPLLLTPPLFSRDLYSYAAQGTMAAHGYDTYQLGPLAIPGPFADSVDPLWITTPAPYGPLFLLLASQITHLTGSSVFITVLGMRLLSVAGAALIVFWLPRLARTMGVNPSAAVWLGAANPLTIIHFVSGGHNDALMVGLIIMAVALAMQQRFVMATLTVVAASGIKIPAAVALAVIAALWARRLGRRRTPVQTTSTVWMRQPVSWKRLLAGFGVTGAVALGGFALLTWFTGYGYGWIEALDTPGTVRTWLSPVTAVGMTISAVLSGLGISTEAVDPVDVTRQIGAVATVIVLAWLVVRRRALAPAQAITLILFTLVILGPVVQSWYLMWAMVPLAAAGVSNRPWRLAGSTHPWLNQASLVMAGIIGLITYSQLNGSILHGPFALLGTVVCWVVSGAVVYHSYVEQIQRFGALPVFTLNFLQRPSVHPLAEGSIRLSEPAQPASTSALTPAA